MTSTIRARAKGALTLVCGTSDLYAMPATVMLYSALTNLAADRSVIVYVLDHGMTPHTRARMTTCLQRLRLQFDLHFREPIPSALTGICSRAPSPAVFDRFTLTRLLPDDVSRVIFLDVDMVIQGDLANLWDTDCDGKALMAVQDFRIPTLRQRLVDRGDSRAHNVDEATPYINGGLLVCNLEALRAEDIEQRVIDDLEDHITGYEYPDQDATNVVLYSHTKLLPPSWNVQVHGVSSGRANGSVSCSAAGLALRSWNEARVIHYTGKAKPWKAMRLRPPAGEAYRRFYRYAKAIRWSTTLAYHLWMNRLRSDLLARQVRKYKNVRNANT